VFQRFPRDHERRAEVHVELERDLLRVLLRERTAHADPGRVDQHVHSAVALGMGGDDADALVGIPEVGGNGQRVELRRGLLERLGPACDQRELVSVLTQSTSNRQSDPRRPACNERRRHARESMWSARGAES
jgi:hypothetical protein